MKVLTVVGARPQLIKAAAVSLVLRREHEEFLVHTGQHYDFGMSEIFFQELGIPAPDANLGIGSGPHGAQTGAMLAALENVITREKPDWGMIYGDTNSTLAGALAAAKLHVPVAHVEAGVRSRNWRMPEEINRVLSDAAADLLLPPTEAAVAHLLREGVHGRVVWVGDVMLDAVKMFSGQPSAILDRLGLVPGGYYVATVHRAENTDDPVRLRGILEAFSWLDKPVVLPLHPRTRKAVADLGFSDLATGLWVDPLGYLDMTVLVRNAGVVLTDSGGLQKEAAFLEVPCVTLRTETEWPETVEFGWNLVVGADTEAIVDAVKVSQERPGKPIGELLRLFGGGQAAERITAALSAR